MTALPVSGKSVPRSQRVFFCKWFDENLVFSKKSVTRQDSRVAGCRFQNHAEFNKTRRRNSANVRLADFFCEAGTVFLIPQDGKNRRSVQDHLGKPRSSYSSS